MGQLSHRVDIPFPLFDADNHLYEPPEALTKYLPKEYKDVVQYVEINGRTKIALKGQISNYIPNPTFSVVAKPGAWEEYFKFGNPDGKSKRELFGEPMRAIPAFFEPAPRLEKMDELGLDRSLMFPTLASLIEERLSDDPVAIHVIIHALNQWLDEVWGFNYQNRIFTTPVITLPIVEKAIEELEWCVKRGARAILIRPAPVPGFRGPRSFALPEFDPFWERCVEYDVFVGMHSSDSGYSRYTSEWDGGAQEMLPFQTNAMSILNEWRPIQDAVASWVIHGALFRFPKLKVGIVEAGSKWMFPLLDSMAEVWKKAPEAFPGNPIEEIKNRIYVSPFYEEGIDDLINLIGVDQVLYGSDWPHPEGLAEPTHYVTALEHLSMDDQAKIMGGNLVPPRHGVTRQDTWQTIPEMVLSAADRFGDAEAVVDGPLRLSFVEVVDRIRCAAGAFAEFGDRQGRPGRDLGAELRRVDHRRVRADDRGRRAGPGQHPIQGRRRPPTSSAAAAPRPSWSRRDSWARTSACPLGVPDDRPEVGLPSRRFAVDAAGGRPRRRRHLRRHLHLGHHRQAQGRDDEPPPDAADVRGVGDARRPARGRPLPDDQPVLPHLRLQGRPDRVVHCAARRWCRSTCSTSTAWSSSLPPNG